MENISSEKSAVVELIEKINSWVDSEEGKSHKQFIVAMIIVLQHSSGIIPNVEIREGKGLILLWPKGEKQYGVLLSSQGSVINICKEQDGRIFASTKINENSNGL